MIDLKLQSQETSTEELFESCFSEETKTPSIAGVPSAEKTAAFAAEKKVDTKWKREAHKLRGGFMQWTLRLV